MNLKIVNPFVMWLIVVSGCIVIISILPQHTMYARTNVTSALFGLMVFFWAYTLMSALYVHRKAPFSADAIDTLITSGIYAHVRHPIYTADILLMWGFFALIYSDLRVLGCVIWMTCVVMIWSKREEDALLDKFGDAYEKYKKRVPMFIPRI